MRRHHRHGLRAASVVTGAALAWWMAAGEPSSLPALEAASWSVLGWAELAAAAAAAELARALVFFTGPAWWVALTTSRARKAYRHRRAGAGLPRPHIPDRLRRQVLAADRHGCVYCGATWSLQMEHIWSWSWGGLTSLWNLITLCGPCNRLKSNYIRFGGREYYRAFEDADDIEAAAAIYDACRRARRSPARLARLAWAHWLG